MWKLNQTRRHHIFGLLLNLFAMETFSVRDEMEATFDSYSLVIQSVRVQFMNGILGVALLNLYTKYRKVSNFYVKFLLINYFALRLRKR